MASAIKYIANVTKSVKYASFDAIKELNPIIADAIDTNEDIIKTTYSTIKNFKKISAKTYQSVKDSEITGLASLGLKNIVEDIKNGTYYNKTRMDEYSNSQVDTAMENIDMGDFHIDMDDDYSDDNDFGMDDLANTIDDVGEKSSSAVSQVIIKGVEHNATVNTKLANKIMAQNTAMIGAIHSDMSVVNTNLSNLLKFNTEIMSTHIQNSAQFFSRQQEQMSEQTAILKELLDITKKKFGESEESYSSDRVSIGDVITASGNLNISQYAKYVKQNIKSKDTGMGDMFKMMMNMGFGKTAVASPLGALLRVALMGATPKSLKEAMEEFNNTFGSIASNVILKANGLKGKGRIKGFLGDIFGVSDQYYTAYDTAGYKKVKSLCPSHS